MRGARTVKGRRRHRDMSCAGLTPGLPSIVIVIVIVLTRQPLAVKQRLALLDKGHVGRTDGLDPFIVASVERRLCLDLVRPVGIDPLDNTGEFVVDRLDLGYCRGITTAGLVERVGTNCRREPLARTGEPLLPRLGDPFGERVVEIGSERLRRRGDRRSRRNRRNPANAALAARSISQV